PPSTPSSATSRAAAGAREATPDAVNHSPKGRPSRAYRETAPWNSASANSGPRVPVNQSPAHAAGSGRKPSSPRGPPYGSRVRRRHVGGQQEAMRIFIDVLTSRRRDSAQHGIELAGLE